MDRQLDALDRVFKALADPTRLRILGILRGGSICVCDIYETLRISQPKASRHLGYLRRAGLVEAEKRGLWVYYRLAPAGEGLVGTLVDAARHVVGHLDVVRRDAGRLERKTGCCVPAPDALTLGCCGRPGQPTAGAGQASDTPPSTSGTAPHLSDRRPERV